MITGDLILRGNVVLPDCVVECAEVHLRDGRIAAVRRPGEATSPVAGGVLLEVGGGFIAPGYFDLHVHGGAGADFMDGTPEAVGRVLAAHLRHGTTSVLATTTAARHEQIRAMLAACRQHRVRRQTGCARLLGVHLYGPYFRREARGCHPGGAIREPRADEYGQYLVLRLILSDRNRRRES